MSLGQSLTLLAIVLQSLGAVLYGTFLAGISTPLFVLVSLGLTGAVFLVGVRFRLPREGRGLLVLANLWTAVGFIGFFFALKHLPPSLFASIEIGTSLLTALALTAVQARAWPLPVRALACLGILSGCALLSWEQVATSMTEPSGALVWIAIIAATATGITTALSASTCKQLAASGWNSASVLAHRFYLTVAIAAVWLPLEAVAIVVPEGSTLALMMMVAALGTLIPLLLLQAALRRTDEVSVLVCMAALPILSFLISLPSPAYEWSWITLAGVLVVTLFVGWDIWAGRVEETGDAARGGVPRFRRTNLALV